MKWKRWKKRDIRVEEMGRTDVRKRNKKKKKR